MTVLFPSRLPAMTVRVLVVEDEAIVAIDIADQLTEAGFLVVGPAPSVAKALKLIEDVGCDVAVLDVNLRDETAEPVARELRFAAHTVSFSVGRLQRPTAAGIQRGVAFTEARPAGGPRRRPAKLDCRIIREWKPERRSGCSRVRLISAVAVVETCVFDGLQGRPVDVPTQFDEQPWRAPDLAGLPASAPICDVHRRSNRSTTCCGTLISSMAPLPATPPWPSTSNADGLACRPADGADRRRVRTGLRGSRRW